jgi:hypothetical protein
MAFVIAKGYSIPRCAPITGDEIPMKVERPVSREHPLLLIEEKYTRVEEDRHRIRVSLNPISSASCPTRIVSSEGCTKRERERESARARARRQSNRTVSIHLTGNIKPRNVLQRGCKYTVKYLYERRLRVRSYPGDKIYSVAGSGLAFSSSLPPSLFPLYTRIRTHAARCGVCMKYPCIFHSALVTSLSRLVRCLHLSSV